MKQNIFKIDFSGIRIGAACLSIILLTVSAGCSSDSAPTPPAEGHHPIEFVNYTTTLARSSAPLSDSWDNFYVVATKDMPGMGGSQQVIPGYRVSYTSQGWSYEDPTLSQYLKYWDLSADSYLFSAVAPTPDNSVSASEGYRNTTVEISPSGEIRINDVVGNLSTGDYQNSSHSPDWMIAQTMRTASPLADTDMIQPGAQLHPDATPLAKMTDEVPLLFHHLMARVEFLVFSPTTLILQSFRVDVEDGQEIITHASYSTPSGWTDKSSPAETSPLTYCDYTFLDGRIISSDPSAPTLISSHVQIPQTWASTGRHLHLTFVTKDGNSYDGSIILNASTNQTNSWDENHIYRYVIKIDTEGTDLDVILFAVDMDTWKWKEGSSYEDIQTGW